MALKKLRPNRFAVDAGYWRIIAIENRFDVKRTTITLASYTSRKAAKDGQSPFSIVEIVCDEHLGAPLGDDEPKKNPDPLPEATRGAAYAAIKSLDDWKDAADVLEADE